MNKNQKLLACEVFFYQLAGLLRVSHAVVDSPYHGYSRYLVPFGTEDQITYHSKPIWSFRMSDHWNWWANLKKCKDENYVQCRSLDMPWVRKRIAPGMASEPRIGIQVAVCDQDGIYHHVFGDKFNRQTRKWSWVENDPELIIQQYLY